MQKMQEMQEMQKFTSRGCRELISAFPAFSAQGKTLYRIKTCADMHKYAPITNPVVTSSPPLEEQMSNLTPYAGAAARYEAAPEPPEPSQDALALTAATAELKRLQATVRTLEAALRAAGKVLASYVGRL
jgi:hypothetical protein